MINNHFANLIEKVVNKSDSRKEAIKILTSLNYPYTDKKITQTEAEHFYYLYKCNEKEIPLDKNYLYKQNKQECYAKGYTKGY